MEISLKLEKAKHLKEAELDLINAVDDGRYHDVIFTTNKIVLEMDRRDSRNVNAIKGVKVAYGMKNGQTLILMGNIGCSFRPPFGGEFFVTKALVENTEFSEISGVSGKLHFSSSYPTDNSYIRSFINDLISNPSFEFNFTQFDEFMDIFMFYKELSNELNNNKTFMIQRVSMPYHFISVSEKNIPVEEENAVIDMNGVIIGYKLDDSGYELLSSEQKDLVQDLIDIQFIGEEGDIKKIKKFKDDLYLSEKESIEEQYTRNLNSFDLVNISFDKTMITLSGEARRKEDFKYLLLYDMGQKIKLESIDNSLRLIKQGETGSAADMLEYIIGDKEMPSGSMWSHRVTSTKKKYVEGLDESQKAAFLMATDGSPVSLIKGPPGTGKTYVINAIVQYITKELGEKVVISSQTHVAIDNVLDELMENYDLIIPNRITNRRNKYSGEEIDKTLYQTWGRNFSEHNNRSSDKMLASQIMLSMANFNGEKKFRYADSMDVNEYSVIGATTTTSEISGKKGLEVLNGYDWLIIDEVSKCPITEVLRYLPYVKHIIMVGDDYQLAPLLEFTEEDVKDLPSFNADKFQKLRRIYEDSVFAKTLQKAEKVGRAVTLNVNYRSLKNILNAYNIFYGGQLVNRREVVKARTVYFDDTIPMFNQNDIFFVDVQNGKEAKEGTSRYNVEEIEATKTILEELIKHTINPEKVSVSAIFPYAAQISLFQKKNLELINTAKKTFKSFEIDTVDAFQGRETDIVLVNTVVTMPYKTFLSDFRRINVSMSRAKDKLFVFGNPTTLSQIDMKAGNGTARRYFAEIIEDIRRFGGRIKYEGGSNYEFASKSKIEII